MLIGHQDRAVLPSKPWSGRPVNRSTEVVVSSRRGEYATAQRGLLDGPLTAT